LAPDLTPLPNLALGELLAVAVDAKAFAAMVLRADGELAHYSYPDFRLQSRYRLEMPAYRAVLDGVGGCLYVATSDPKALQVNRQADRPVGRGDLHVYDVRALLAGTKWASRLHRQTESASRLHPKQVIPLDGDVSHLLLAPGREAVYYLLHRPDGDSVGRVPTSGVNKPRSLTSSEPIDCLCLAPDGTALYGARPGAVITLDPLSLRQRRVETIDAAICDISADEMGRVFAVEQGQAPWLSVLIPERNTVLTRWPTRLHGRNYVAVTPEGSRIYLATSSLLSRTLLSLRIFSVHNPQPTAQIHSDDSGPVRGEFFLTPDSKYLITRWGKVFQLAPLEPERRSPPNKGRIPGVSAS
jgi:hypothetical protein